MSPDRAPPLHLGLFTPAWPAGALANGIVTYTAEMVPALRAAGHRVSVLAGRDEDGRDPDVIVPEAPRPSLPMRLLERLRPDASARRRRERGIVDAVRRLRTAHDLDLLEIEESFGWCGAIADESPVPVVARLHGPWFLNGPMVADADTPAFRARVEAEGDALRRVAAITAPSADVLERVRAHYGEPLPPAEVIFNPLSPPRDEERWRRENAEPGSILFVGRFDGHKGGDVVIDAFRRIHAESPDATLTFVGPDRGIAGPSGTIGIEAFAAERLPVAARAAFRWRGPLGLPEIRALRRRAAVVVVASRYEILGYTLAEAMSQGCPIVATAVGGFRELVEHERSARMVPPDDADALARETLRLLREPAHADELGRAARLRYDALLAPDAIVAKTVDFYRRVLERAGDRTGG